MAAGVVKTLRSEVMCPLCLDVFTDPKRLPCEHVYCKDCLHGLALRSINETISCPECRKDTVLPKLDVTTLSTAYQVNRLIEMYKKSLETEEVTTPRCSTCEIHKSQFLTSFCKTCKSLVCPDCVSLLCARKHHECGLVDEMVERFQAVMEREREPILVLHQQVSATCDAMVAAEREVLNAKETRLQQVESTFDALSHILAKERSFCKESIEKFFQDQTHLDSGKCELSQLLSNLELLTKSIKKTSSKESKETFLASFAEKEEILQAAKLASSNNLSSVPAEMIVELHSPSEFGDTLKIEDIFHRVRIEPLPELVSTFAVTRFPLHFSLYEGRAESVEKIENVTAEIFCHDGSLQSLSIEKVAPEKYSISFLPQERGAHKFSVKYNDTLICGSPLPIYVTMEPEKLKKLSSTKLSSTKIKIKNIAGIEYFEQKLYLSDPDNGIVIFDPLTKLISEIVDLKGVGDLVVEKDYFYVTDVTKHVLVKAEPDGTIVKSVGTKGNAPGEFKHPKGIRVSNNNELYVCDMGNHRIQVFDKALKFLRSIGDRRSGGSFQFPGNLDFDETGNMYVTDQDNHCIQVLTPDGGHIRNIGMPGKKAGELYRPISVAVHKNMVYVADRVTKGISVFKTTGEFLTVFGKGALSHPQCMAIDEHGYIHVTDDRCKIVLF